MVVATRWFAQGVMVVALGLVLLLRGVLPTPLQEGLPFAAERGALTILFGDARRLVSQAMLERVDTYYHGGAQVMECSGMEVEVAEVEAAAGEELQCCEAGDCRHHHHHVHRSGAGARWAWQAPWRGVHQRLRVQEHRHLREEHFNELLPWVWAACRAAPENIQAYQVGAYVLWRYSGVPETAMELLFEGVKLNPGSPELAYELGEYYLHRLKEQAAAEVWFKRAHEKNRSGAAMSEERQLLQLRTLQYLGHLAWQRGDKGPIEGYLREAEELNRQHHAVKLLQSLLAEPVPARGVGAE